MVPPEVLIDALIFSNLLSLLSIGLTLTYLTLKVPNFAHGDFATVGIYLAYTALRLLSLHPLFMLPPAFVFSGLVALFFYYVVFKPLSDRGANIVSLMVASIAVEIIMRHAIYAYSDAFGLMLKTFSRGFIFKDVYLDLGGLRVPSVALVSTALSLALVVSLYLLLTRTKFGVAMRASIENPDLARTMGIDVERVYAVSWFMAGGLAGMAGVLLPFRMPGTPDLGWELLLRVFAATVLGGLENIYGAILGSYILGFAEVVGIFLLSGPPLRLSTAYRPSIAFITLIVVLLVAPKGITGIDWRQLARRLRGEGRGL